MAEPETRPDTGILKEGDLFDKYRIVRRSGHGGMAEVYQAEHLLLNRIFALKLMRYPDSARTNRDVYQQRFLREARLTFSLDHPSVVRVFDAGCDRKSGLLFIVMEYVEGRTLESFIPERHPGDRRDRSVFRQSRTVRTGLDPRRCVVSDLPGTLLQRRPFERHGDRRDLR